MKKSAAKVYRRYAPMLCLLLTAALLFSVIFSSCKSIKSNHRIASLENQVSSMQSAVDSHDKTVSEFEEKLALAESKADDEHSQTVYYRRVVGSIKSPTVEQKALIAKLDVPLNGKFDGQPEPEGKKTAYLTFDDGPSDHTEQILDILTEKDAVATFFVINSKHLGKTDAIVRQGSAVAMHSASHDYSKIYLSADAYFSDLYKIETRIYEESGVRPKILRLPGGSSNTQSKKYANGVMTKIADRLNKEGYVYFDWNVDSKDAARNGVPAADLLKNVQNGVGSKKVVNILMHDTNAKDTTVEALPQIIDWLKSEGYEFRTLSTKSTVTHHKINN